MRGATIRRSELVPATMFNPIGGFTANFSSKSGPGNAISDMDAVNDHFPSHQCSHALVLR
jgi:hypothetical protein